VSSAPALLFHPPSHLVYRKDRSPPHHLPVV
jgi:hypothetical protein